MSGGEKGAHIARDSGPQTHDAQLTDYTMTTRSVVDRNIFDAQRQVQL